MCCLGRGLCVFNQCGQGVLDVDYGLWLCDVDLYRNEVLDVEKGRRWVDLDLYGLMQ